MRNFLLLSFPSLKTLAIIHKMFLT